jgi:hypothetical protein
VLYGCEEYRTYHEHKEFCLHIDNQALDELELRKNLKGINAFWETALSNLRKARAIVADI